MYCLNCGKEIPEHARFCTQCGQPTNVGTGPAGSHGGPRQIYQEGQEGQEQEQYRENDTDEPQAEYQPVGYCCGCKNYAVPSPQENLDWYFLPVYYQEQFSRIRGSDGNFAGSFNWIACVLSVFWLLTKGCWLAAVIFSGIIGIASALSEVGVIAAVIIVAFLAGIRGNYIYYTACVRNQQVIW